MTPKPQANTTILMILDKFEAELLSALATARDTHRLIGKDTGSEYSVNHTKIQQDAIKDIETLITEVRIDEVENYPDPHGDPDRVEIAIHDRLTQLRKTKQ